MNFEFPDDIDPVFIEGDPEGSYAQVGFSLLLPYLEPYLIRTMKIAKGRVTDPDLLADLEKFSAQEGQHYREHRKFNDVIRKHGFEHLKALEEDLDGDYQRFSKTKSLRFNLAYAEGFEALTTASALFSFEQGFIGEMHPAAQDLWTWHLLEELEHRTVAFDVYDHVCGGYLYRLFVGLYAQFHMLRFTFRAARAMLAADPGALERCGGKAGRRARGRERLRRMLPLIPMVLRTYTPWYTPHKIEPGSRLKALGEGYSARAVRTS